MITWSAPGRVWQARVRRVAVPLFENRTHRRLAYDVGCREIRLSQAKIDAARGSAVEELPDGALLDAGEPACRLERAHRSASSSEVAASVWASRYLTITGV
jgi:hypothetical protein